jgi:type II secretory pathway pseudopilin PulG
MTPTQIVVLVLLFVQAISVVPAVWVYLYITWRKRHRRQIELRDDEEQQQQQQEYRSQYGSSQENYIYSDNGYSWVRPPEAGAETIQTPVTAAATASTQTENQEDNYEDPYTPPSPSPSQTITCKNPETDPLTLRPCPFCKGPHNWKTSDCDPKTTGTARWIKINENNSKLTML